MSEVISGELISGKEAAIAYFKDMEVQTRTDNESNWKLVTYGMTLAIFLNDEREFRLKPHTITVNVEIEKPKEIVLDAITGAVGLVYGDLDKARVVQEALREVFK